MNKNTNQLLDEAIAVVEQNPNIRTGTSASHLIIHGTRVPTKRSKAVLYLCDGEIPACGKDECYKRGRECRHTTDVGHALNPEHRPPTNTTQQHTQHQQYNKVWYFVDFKDDNVIVQSE